MNPETLKAIIQNPATSPADRSTAQRQLGQPEEQAPPSGHLLEPELLRFAGAARLEDIPPAVIVQFADHCTADPEALKNLCADWHLMRTLQGYPVAEATWDAIKRHYAEPERRAAFECLTEQYPFLGPSPITLRLWSEEVEYLRTLCEQNGERATRRYFVPRIRELLERLPEFALAARDEAKSLLEKYEGKNR